LMQEGDFIEIYCRCSVEVCETRDVKGLYKLAREGKVKEFTGISSPYEEPLSPELVIETGSMTLEQCVEKVLNALRERGIVPHGR
jgi:adenylylsulfate kinase